MPQATHTAIYKIPLERLYNVIADYPSYPEFLPQFQEVKVLKHRKKSLRLEAVTQVRGITRYIMEVTFDAPHRVEWEFVEGDTFRSMSGWCELEHAGKHKTQVTYHVDVELRFFVPAFLVNKGLRDQLPPMLEKFYKRALEQ